MGKWTGGKGIPLIIDAVGIPDLFPVFLRMASPAGRIGVAGVLESPVGACTAGSGEERALHLRVTAQQEQVSRGHFLVRRTDRWNLNFVSHRYPFEKSGRQWSSFRTIPSEVCKVILEF